MADSRLCTIPDCGKPIGRGARGLCFAHYKRWRRHGDPLGGRKTFRGDLPKFLQKVREYEGDDCIFWPYSRTHGRGFIRLGGRSFSVSRLMCEEMNGPPPKDRNEAAHSCNKGHLGCVTKKHLNWKTHQENMDDMEAAGSRARGETHGFAKLTNADVSHIRILLTDKKITEVAALFGISRQAVNDIKHQRTWRHI